MKRRLTSANNPNAELLLQFLNENRQGGCVENYVDRFRHLAAWNEKAKRSGPGYVNEDGQDVAALETDLWLLGDEIQKSLQVSPSISRAASGVIQIEWTSSNASADGAKPLVVWTEDGGSITETQALLALLEVARTGQLLQLDWCRECTQWMFRRRRDQKFCSRKCRQNYCYAKPEVRQKRNEYLRTNYRARVLLGK